jgi:hypothetical protein
MVDQDGDAGTLGEVEGVEVGKARDHQARLGGVGRERARMAGPDECFDGLGDDGEGVADGEVQRLTDRSVGSHVRFLQGPCGAPVDPILLGRDASTGVAVVKMRNVMLRNCEIFASTPLGQCGLA